MLTQEEFKKLLENQKCLLIDGALATELENRGNDLDHPLWSAKVLEEDPMCIKQVHLDYFIAGADIAITASYQASIPGLAAHLGLDDKMAAGIIKRSVMLARLALEESYGQGVRADRQLLVAGSVGPYGAYLADGSEYRGDYQRTKSEFKDFHRPRIAALVEADVDLLAIETMPQFEEIRAVLELLHEEFSSTISWLCCTLKDPGHISDGTPLKDVLRVADKYKHIVAAFGVNCIPVYIATESLQNIKDHTDLPLVCYPNSGETWDAKTKSWSSYNGRNNIDQKVQQWQDAGAKLIGGCCRTGPEFIMNVAKVLKR